MREMKDSGADWMGSIPKNWSTVRMKSCIVQRDSGAWGDEATGEIGDYICLRIADFNYGKFVFNDSDSLTIRHYPPQTINKLNLCKGDILIEKSGGGEKTPVGRTVIFDKDYEALFANFMDRLRCADFILPKYMQYIFVTFYKNEYSRNYIKQTTGIQNLDLTTMLAKEVAPLPDIDEQCRITDFLDHECAEIDSVLEKTRLSIEEYKKLKQAVITQAVTKGIRGDRPMKTSGYEHLGEIPIEWSAQPLRTLISSCQNGISKSGDLFGSGYPFVSYSDVYKNMELPQKVKGLVQSTDADRKLYSVLRGDIFFTRTSETIEEIGFTSVCLTDIPEATFSGFLIRVRPQEGILLPEYSKYFFRSDIHRLFFVKEMNLVTRASLGQGLLKRLPVLISPLKEQEEIAVYLDDKCEFLDSIIEKNEKLLIEVENYKKSLIYEYVTGKKEV